MVDDCRALINHLSRIEGQIRSLKKLISGTNDCQKLTRQSAAVVKSFDTFRAKLVEAILAQSLLKPNLNDQDRGMLEDIEKLIKA